MPTTRRRASRIPGGPAGVTPQMLTLWKRGDLDALNRLFPMMRPWTCPIGWAKRIHPEIAADPTPPPAPALFKETIAFARYWEDALEKLAATPKSSKAN